MRRINPLLIIAFLVMQGCVGEFYEYNRKKYRVFKQVESKNINKIEALDLSSNKLLCVPSEIYSLDKIVFLNFRNNQIDTIDNQICNLKNLRILLLDNNPGIVLPDCIFDANSLELLSLTNCKQEQFMEKLGKLTNLRYLVIGGNNFSEAEIQLLKSKLENTKVVTSID